MATARAILRLCRFPALAGRRRVFPAATDRRCGARSSAYFFRSDTSSRRAFTRASAELTHTDPRAVEAALVVAEAASLAANRTPTAQALPALEAFAESREMQARFKALRASLDEQQSVEEFAIAIGCGDQVSGFAPNSAALALYAWLRHRGDFASAIAEVVRAGGDTDTGAAIAGGICGAEVGAPGIPHAWVERIADWPLSVGALRDLAERLSMEVGGRKSSFGDLRFFAAPMRNLLFLAIILFHGFRRLLPPY
ncbi:MAG: ADP-ribosylglycohydrolase family protein [Verrucomicrobiales bacterium]